MISSGYVASAEVFGPDWPATDPVGSAERPGERSGELGQARARALVMLHEAGAILLEVGDLAGVRVFHGAVGVLLGAPRSGGKMDADEADAEGVASGVEGTTAERAGERVRRAG